MKKVVLKLDLHDDKSKQKGQKAMSIVSGLLGVDSVSMDAKRRKLTVTGDVDPVVVVRKLRKLCPTNIVSVGPAKEPEKKKEEPKKEEPKKTKEKKKHPNDKKKRIIKAQALSRPYQAKMEVILKLELQDDKSKRMGQKAMRIVSGLSGVDSISMDMKHRKLTVRGDMDPVFVVTELRNVCPTTMISVGPVNEPVKKKSEPKKDDKKKDPNDKKKRRIKKLTLKLDFHRYESMEMARIIVAKLSDVDSISMNMKHQELTVRGDMDPDAVMRKLKDLCPKISKKREGEKFLILLNFAKFIISVSLSSLLIFI